MADIVGFMSSSRRNRSPQTATLRTLLRPPALILWTDLLVCINAESISWCNDVERRVWNDNEGRDSIPNSGISGGDGFDGVEALGGAQRRAPDEGHEANVRNPDREVDVAVSP